MSRFLRQTWRGWKAYNDPQINNWGWGMEATADWISMGLGMALGRPLGPVGIFLGGYFAPELIKSGSLWYAAPFTSLSIQPAATEAKRVHRVLEQRRQQQVAMSRVQPSRGPTFASPGSALMRCPPGYHLKDGACIED